METNYFRIVREIRINEMAMVKLPHHAYQGLEEEEILGYAIHDADTAGKWKEIEKTVSYDEVERMPEDYRMFCVSRDRDVSEVVRVLAETEEDACEVAQGTHWTEWEPVDSHTDNYEADEVER